MESKDSVRGSGKERKREGKWIANTAEYRINVSTNSGSERYHVPRGATAIATENDT